jgi:hypothetical protein
MAKRESKSAVLCDEQLGLKLVACDSEESSVDFNFDSDNKFGDYALVAGVDDRLIVIKMMMMVIMFRTSFQKM